MDEVLQEWCEHEVAVLDEADEGLPDWLEKRIEAAQRDDDEAAARADREE